MLDSDFVRLNLEIGTVTLYLKELGWSWPPPDRIYMKNPRDEGPGVRAALPDDDHVFVMERASMSQLSEADVASTDGRVMRGAEYHYLRTEETFQ